MRKIILNLLAVVLTLPAAFAAATGALSQEKVPLNIEPQAMDQALNALAQQTGLQLLFRADTLGQGLISPRLVGSYTREAALEQLLADTQLDYQILDERTVTIRPKATGANAAGTTDSWMLVADAPEQGAQSADSTLRIAQAEGAPADSRTSPPAQPELSEIVVTATRRAESLAKVPYNIQAITAETLTRIGATDLRDFMRMVPGLSFEEGGPRDGTTSLVLRGLTGDYGSRTTTSTYVDDTQVDSLDLKLLDIERFEVLRGPQGTLFGGGAIGGTLRYISRKPQLDEWETQASAQLSQTGRDGGMNHEVTGVLNAPLVNDKLALRLAAGVYDNEGYINNTRLGRDKVNWDRTFSSRVALLYAPTDEFRAQLTYYRQHINYGTSSTIADVLGENNVDDHFQEGSRGDQNLVNLTLSYDFGFAALTSSTSHTDDDTLQLNDETYYQRRSYGFDGLDSYSTYRVTGKSTTEELRLVSAPGERWDWIAGTYWSKNENRAHLESHIPIPFASQEELGEVMGLEIADDHDGVFHDQNDYRQWAFFGELNRHLTDRWRASVGARYFDYKIDGYNYYIGQYSPDGRNPDGTPREVPVAGEINDGVADSSGNVWRFNTSYDLGRDRLLYATVAEGFRPGGFNTDPNAPPERRQYDPDSIVSYEIGAKLGFADNRVFMSTAIYHIDWSDMQTVKFGVTDDGAFYYAYTNAGEARSQGVEFELGTQGLLLDGLALTATFALTDMQLKEDVEELGLKGDHAPLVPRRAGSLLADYTVPVGGLQAGLTLRTSFTGESFNSFGPLIPSGGELYENNYDRKRSYWMSGAAARLEGAAWTARLFVDNLFDEDPDLSVGRTTTSGESFGEPTVIRALERPRTIGVDVAYRF